MDPSLAAIRRQGNKASESTTDGREERLQSGRGAHPTPGQAGRSILRHYKGMGREGNAGSGHGNAVPLREIAPRGGAHPGGWAAHLYCIGDGTLIWKLVEKAARLLLE
jgi:hypothetical protein